MTDTASLERRDRRPVRLRPSAGSVRGAERQAGHAARGGLREDRARQVKLRRRLEEVRTVTREAL